MSKERLLELCDQFDRIGDLTGYDTQKLVSLVRDTLSQLEAQDKTLRDLEALLLGLDTRIQQYDHLVSGLRSQLEALNEWKADATIRLDERSKWIDELRADQKSLRSQLEAEKVRTKQLELGYDELGTTANRLQTQLEAAKAELAECERERDIFKRSFTGEFPARASRAQQGGE